MENYAFTKWVKLKSVAKVVKLLKMPILLIKI